MPGITRLGGKMMFSSSRWSTRHPGATTQCSPMLHLCLLCLGRKRTGALDLAGVHRTACNTQQTTCSSRSLSPSRYVERGSLAPAPGDALEALCSLPCQPTPLLLVKLTHYSAHPRAGSPRRAEAELLRILNDVAEGLHMYLLPPTQHPLPPDRLRRTPTTCALAPCPSWCVCALTNARTNRSSAPT